MTKVKQGDKVQIHYNGTLDDGTIFDESGGRGEKGDTICAPMELVIGEENDDFLPKFQEAIIGLEPGQSVQVKIASEDAYGPRFEDKVFVIKRDELKTESAVYEDWVYANHKKIWLDPKRGDVLQLAMADGSYIPVMVTKLNETSYTVDANHPLAGKNLTYDITLVDIL